MKDDLKKALDERVLPYVETPGQYIGSEPNSLIKDRESVAVSVALAFPDAYTVGISHLGFQILYSIVNARSDALAERVYAPFPDMAGKLREEHVPLYSLETFTPIGEFDIVGFSLQYEMCYTNVLLMLDLANIPLPAELRTQDHPLIVAGGPCAVNPEPMSAFVDLFIIGDGEAAIGSLIDEYKAIRGKAKDRREMLIHLAKTVPGAYVPSLYDVTYHDDGTVESIRPNARGVPQTVQAAVVESLDDFPLPHEPIVPLVEAVHDRITLEAVRGCTHGCRYCQAGMIKRPFRPRAPQTLLETARKSYESTGHSEISLTALSISDYPHLFSLLEGLCGHFDPLRVNISLPSLRVNQELFNLPSVLSSVRKSGLTLAPEAATEELRRRINKNITDDDLLQGVLEAYQAGWETVKLYFMIGLPGESQEDVDAIAELAKRVSLLRKWKLGKAPARVNLSAAPFVPKPHTPFQWEPMATRQDVWQKQIGLREQIKKKNIWLKAHKPDRSYLEGVFSRGDRRLGAVLFEAYRQGCTFAAWEEYFDFEKWLAVLEECGVDGDFYAYRERPEYELLPWDHVSVGVTKEFLLKERHKALAGEPTLNCREATCHACGLQEMCRRIAGEAKAQ